MELSEKYKIELANLQKAVSSFEAALNATFDNLVVPRFATGWRRSDFVRGGDFSRPARGIKLVDDNFADARRNAPP